MTAMMALAAALSAQAAVAPEPPPAPDYAKPAAWLCLSGRADPCSQPLPTAELTRNGYGPVSRSVPAKAPAADCFYVYPTVSRDPGENADMVAGPEELAVASVQFARFGSVCRTFAPLYRQATLTALLAGLARPGGPPRNLELAYRDVRAAWRHYLARENGGRPFVLIGHSQGTILLSRLLAEEIEGSPASNRMLSAMLIGYNVEVPRGRLVGGTFKRTPLCSRVGETGCVVTYVSFRATSPPPAVSRFGRARREGMTVGCTNPAGLARGSAPLTSYWFAGASTPAGATPIAWSRAGAPSVPFLLTRDLVSAVCVNSGPLGYLAVRVNADPADARTDRIPGDVVREGKVDPAWGLHLADMNLAQGDLIALVEAQARAFRPRR